MRREQVQNAQLRRGQRSRPRRRSSASVSAAASTCSTQSASTTASGISPTPVRRRRGASGRNEIATPDRGAGQHDAHFGRVPRSELREPLEQAQRRPPIVLRLVGAAALGAHAGRHREDERRQRAVGEPDAVDLRPRARALATRPRSSRRRRSPGALAGRGRAPGSPARRCRRGARPPGEGARHARARASGARATPASRQRATATGCRPAPAHRPSPPARPSRASPRRATAARMISTPANGARRPRPRPRRARAPRPRPSARRDRARPDARCTAAALSASPGPRRSPLR